MVRSISMRLAMALAALAALLLVLSCSGDAGRDSGDDDAADDDAGDDDSAGPSILDTSHGNCKTGSAADDWPWPQGIEFDYADGVLTVTHVNGVFNCCLDSIEVTMQMEGDWTIDLYEQEVTTMPCDCICPYDVVTRIEGLASVTYTVNIFANGVFAVSGDVKIP